MEASRSSRLIAASNALENTGDSNEINIANNPQFQSLTNNANSFSNNFMSQFSFPGVFGEVISLMGPEAIANLLIDFLKGQIISLMDELVSSSNALQIIQNILPNLQLTSSEQSQISNQVNKSSEVYDPAYNPGFSIESVSGDYIDPSSEEGTASTDLHLSFNN